MRYIKLYSIRDNIFNYTSKENKKLKYLRIDQ